MSQFSIKDIEALTGIKAHTLRIWEQRYSLPQPKRTESNIRYYDDDDLKLLLNVAMLNRHGHKISEITRLSEQQIRDIALDISVNSTHQSTHIQGQIASMINLDERAFEKILSTCVLQYGLQRTVMEVVFPFMSLVGAMWQTGSVNPAFEHFMSNLIRQKLIVAIDAQEIRPVAHPKNFLLFLPEGEHHELGLLFANYIIRSRGHRSLYLGQNLPVSDLARVSERFVPDVVFTSVTTGLPREVVEGMVKELKDSFPGASILLTGRYFSEHATVNEDVTIVQRPSDLDAFWSR